MLSPEDDENFESERVSYMFRCASTYNWYALNDYCSSFLIAYHSSALVMNRRSMLSTIRKELLFTDQWGNTVLHSACFQQPPLDVIEILLNMARQACILQELVSKRSRDGSTALLVACATGATFEVIEALLLLSDIRNSPSMTAYSIKPSFQQLLSQSQKNLTDNKQEQLQPCEVNTNENHEVTLVSSYFSSKYGKRDLSLWLPIIPDDCGATPLSELCNQYHIMRKSSLSKFKLSDTPPVLANVSSVEELESFPDLKIFWNKVNLVLQASIPIFKSNQFDKSNQPFMANAMASISHTCPIVLSTLICKIYPPNIFSQRNEFTGLLPLHQAISFSVPFFYNSCCDTNGNCLSLVSHRSQQIKFQEQQFSLVRNFAEIYPTAARSAVPIIIGVCDDDDDDIMDDGGTTNVETNDTKIYWRTPFCHAIMAGLTWNNYDSFPTNSSYSSCGYFPASQQYSKTCNCNNTNDDDFMSERSVLQCLAKHAPESLDSRDIITGLYPLMLAATVALQVPADKIADNNYYQPTSEKAIEDQQNLLDLAQLDSIYNLLLNNPQHVAVP